MFGSMVRKFREGQIGGKAVHVLLRTYSLALDQSHVARIQRMALDYGLAESFNEHEIAVFFLANFIKDIKPDHPKAKAEVTKYIRFAKGAKNRGLIRSDIPLVELFEAAQRHFGIDHSEIEAA